MAVAPISLSGLNWLTAGTASLFFLRWRHSLHHFYPVLYRRRPICQLQGFFQGRWFAEKWPSPISQTESSAFYEISPIAVACRLWGSLWEHKHIVAFCENAAVVEAINEGCTSSKTIIPFLRHITCQSVNNNFSPSACHVPGHANIIADALSHLQFQTFQCLCPSANLLLTPVPSFEDLDLN